MPRSIVSVHTPELRPGDIVYVDDMRLEVKTVEPTGCDDYHVTFADGWEVDVTAREWWERAG